MPFRSADRADLRCRSELPAAQHRPGERVPDPRSTLPCGTDKTIDSAPVRVATAAASGGQRYAYPQPPGL